MSEDKAVSTSSTETDDSRPWPEVASLGEKIVRDLGLGDSVDTLGRWMAHRTAELIQRGEEGDEQAQAEARSLIFELWRRRSDWPKGWPPRDSALALERIVQSTQTVHGPTLSRGADVDEVEGPWLSRAAAVAALQTSERQTWHRLGLMRLDIDEEAELAADRGPFLSDDELTTMQRLAILNADARSYFERKLDGREPTEEACIAVARADLDELEQQRRDLFEEAVMAARADTGAEPDEGEGAPAE